jgi:hypothetical protein
LLTHTPILTNTTTDITLDEVEHKSSKQIRKENKEVEKRIRKATAAEEKKYRQMEQAEQTVQRKAAREKSK